MLIDKKTNCAHQSHSIPIIHGYTLNNYALFLQIAIANVIFVSGFQNQICARSGINIWDDNLSEIRTQC